MPINEGSEAVVRSCAEAGAATRKKEKRIAIKKEYFASRIDGIPHPLLL
jgi:hypothetical protein